MAMGGHVRTCLLVRRAHALRTVGPAGLCHGGSFGDQLVPRTSRVAAATAGARHHRHGVGRPISGARARLVAQRWRNRRHRAVVSPDCRFGSRTSGVRGGSRRNRGRAARRSAGTAGAVWKPAGCFGCGESVCRSGGRLGNGDRATGRRARRVPARRSGASATRAVATRRSLGVARRPCRRTSTGGSPRSASVGEPRSRRLVSDATASSHRPASERRRSVSKVDSQWARCIW
jgi:hypothetical protein